MGSVIISKERKAFNQKQIVVSSPHLTTCWLNEGGLVLLGYAMLIIFIFWINLPPLRVGLAIVLMLFGSGYSLLTLLFPRTTHLDGLMKAAVAGGLSLAVDGMIGFMLVNSIWGLKLVPLLTATILFNTACYFGIVYRRRKATDIPNNADSTRHPKLIVWVPKANRYRNTLTGRWVASKTVQSNGKRNIDGTIQQFDKPIEVLKRKLAAQSIGSTALTLALMLLIALGIKAFVQAAAVTSADPPMTEFFLLNVHGMAEGYPTIVRPGQTLVTHYGIVNHEDQLETYRVEVMAGDEIIGESEAMTLDVGEKLQAAIILEWPEYGILAQPNSQKVRFVLYRGEQEYRTLHLWLDVKLRGSINFS